MECEINKKINFCPYCGKKLHENCQCWIKKHEYNCGYNKCPGYNLFALEKAGNKLYCIDEKELEKCRKDFTLDDFRGKDCVIGVASPSKLEIMSIIAEFKSNKHYYAVSFPFITERAYKAKMEHSMLHGDVVTDVKIISNEIKIYKYIEKLINSIKEKNDLNVREIVYDPYDSFKLADILEKDGYTTVECRQGFHKLNEPTCDLIENIHSGTLHHNGNSALEFAIKNMAIKENTEGLIMLDRAKSASDISPISALINAHLRGMYIL